MSNPPLRSPRMALIDVPKPEPFDTTEYEGKVGSFTSGPTQTTRSKDLEAHLTTSPSPLPSSSSFPASSLSGEVPARPASCPSGETSATGIDDAEWKIHAPDRPAPPPPVAIGRPTSAVIEPTPLTFSSSSSSKPEESQLPGRLSMRHPSPSDFPLSSSAPGTTGLNPARQSAPQPFNITDMFEGMGPPEPPPAVPQRTEAAGYFSSSLSAARAAPSPPPPSTPTPVSNVPGVSTERQAEGMDALTIGGGAVAVAGGGESVQAFFDLADQSPSSSSFPPSSSSSLSSSVSSSSAMPLSSSSSSSSTVDPKALSASLIEYEKYRERALTTDFSKIEPLKIIYTAGHDSLGRPVVAVVANHLNVKKTDLDALLLYTIHILDPIVDADYVLVFFGTNFSRDNRPSLAWLRKAYSILNRKFKKNLKMLYIVHAAWGIKAALNLFRPFVSAKFWKKVVLIDNVTDIYKTIGRSEIWIPDSVIAYNLKHNKQRPIFGVPLEEVLNIEHSKTGIPQIVIESVNYLSYHYDTEGLFRKSGEARLIDEIRKAYDKGEDVELTTAIQDPHAVAGLLKLFLRDLPNPVIPFDLYDVMLQSHRASVGNEEVWIHVMKGLLGSLPKANYALLEYLFMMMQEVSKYSEKNLMTPSNLAIVFAPNLLRLGDESDLMAVMRDTPIVNSIIKKIIECTHSLFPNAAPAPNNTPPGGSSGSPRG